MMGQSLQLRVNSLFSFPCEHLPPDSYSVSYSGHCFHPIDVLWGNAKPKRSLGSISGDLSGCHVHSIIVLKWMARAEEKLEEALKSKWTTDHSQKHTFSSSSFPCQVLSPLAKNLFHRAISESGVAFIPGMFTKDVRPITEVGPTLENRRTLSWSCQGSFWSQDSAMCSRDFQSEDGEQGLLLGLHLNHIL